MKQLTKWFIKACVAGVCALALLSAFCVAYSYDGIHIANETGATDYKWKPYQLKTNMWEGFSWIRMDAYGYNNVADYSEEPDILVMGSSHIEGAQVKKTENVGYVLNTLLPDYRTYNIGISGHTIYRCVDNLENALKTYHPQKYVVLIIDSAELSVSDMEAVICEEAEPIPSYNSGLVYQLQRIPAIKTIYKQLDNWVSLEQESTATVATEKEQNLEEYKTVLLRFLEVATRATEEHKVELILVVKPSYKLKENSKIQFQYKPEMMDILEAVCAEKGIAFCNMTDTFADMFYRENLLAYGFTNSEVGDGHLNAYGHRALAEAVCAVIQEKEGQ